jgi:hypothetical protein
MICVFLSEPNGDHNSVMIYQHTKKGGLRELLPRENFAMFWGYDIISYPKINLFDVNPAIEDRFNHKINETKQGEYPDGINNEVYDSLHDVF